jgi:isopentenyl-diphosphate delta-isomerase
LIVDEASDVLILVDEADRDVGQSSKASCHDGRGMLHRAFSLLIFNAAGELLIQQRAASKRLWPLYWSNSCCSHPRIGESMESATQRRLGEELGISCPLEFLFKFQYHAQFGETGSENELCSVFIGSCSDPVVVNREEISNWRWVSPEILQGLLSSAPRMKFTPWFLLEWSRIWNEHREAVLKLQG